MKKILIIQKIHESGIKILQKRKDFTYEMVDKTELSFLKKKIRDCDGVSIRTAKLNFLAIFSLEPLPVSLLFSFLWNC